jgi:hypothetical protein
MLLILKAGWNGKADYLADKRMDGLAIGIA